MNSPITKAILLVEDDDNDVVFMKIAMEKAGIGHLLRVAGNGQRAIDYFEGTGEFADRKRYPLPAVVLLDMKLPEVMGVDVLKWIRQHRSRTIIVIVLTSSSQEKDMQTAYELGANAYVVKPGNPRKLNELVDLVHRFWLTINQPTAGTPEPSRAIPLAPIPS